jgi:hypothetical protein
METKELTKHQQKRLELSQLSGEMRKIKELKMKEAQTPEDILYWSSHTINDLLMKFVYNPVGDLVFNTFNQWRKEGKFVKKGEKGIIVWGQPIAAKAKEIRESSEGKEPLEANYEMYPLCYLFSDKQVA